MKKDTQPIAYYGHHKCASSWFRRLFEDVGRWTGRKFDGFDNPRQFDNDLPTHLNRHGLEMFSFTNAEYPIVKSVGNHKSVHLIRDPRDILVSAYFSHLNSHSTEGWPELEPHRKRLHGLDTEEGLLAELEFSECYLRQMSEWNYQNPDIYEARFEVVTIYPYEQILAIFEHLGICKDADATPMSRIAGFLKVTHLSLKRRFGLLWPFIARSESVPSHQLLLIVHQQRYRKLAGGRKKGEENTKSHYRKGKSGDWRNYFDQELTTAFEERYPGLIEKSGYTDSG